MNEWVVLLHGLGRSRFSMRRLARALSGIGYGVWNKSYASTRQTIEQSAAAHIPAALAFCRQQGADQIHFVTHSLGGILLRYYLQSHRITNLGKVVMLSPPNHGSEIVDRCGHMRYFRWILGPAGQQLGTQPDSLPNRLQPLRDVCIGIITGGRSSDPWFSHFFNGVHDGKVCAESAKLPEMKDFRVVQAGHTFIMNHAEVQHQVVHFLRHGYFANE